MKERPVPPPPGGPHRLRSRTAPRPGHRGALGSGPTGRAPAHLRAHALTHADEIAASGDEPYRPCLAVRRTARHEARGPLGTGSPLPSLVVLTPLMAGTSAVALLLTGGLLHVADALGPLPGSLVAAGWTLALVAALTGLVPLAALLHRALRRRDPPPTADQVEHARLVWRQELLGRGKPSRLRPRRVPHPETVITPCSPPDTLTPCPARAREDRTPCSD
ncbi:hypothetical protein ACFU3E_31635 [Streptomyces sp. NPDC057424]|uniref:hypothetical protein n=1 Tax=Streptomyces sp. NPDC057424 TaxID=3346127 RepID=UPI0036B98F54